MQNFTAAPATFGRGVALLLLLLPLAGWGQVTIATQDFEGAPPPNVALTGGALLNGTLPSPGLPANAPYATSGARGFTVNNGTGTATASSNISLAGFTNVNISFRLSGLSLNATNGIDGADNATLEISLDGGASYSKEIQVVGSINNRWAYSATGVGATVYDGDNVPTVVPSPSGAAGISTVTVTGINPTPTANQLRYRITLFNNDANERWAIDDVVVATVAPPAAPVVVGFTPASGPVGTVVVITGAGFTGTVGVAFNGTAAPAVTVVSPGVVQATVPAGATTGPIAVSNAFGTGTSPGVFTVTPPAAASPPGLLLFEDDFNYPAGTTLAANGWAVHSGNGMDVPGVVAGNLAQATYPTGPLATNANRVSATGTSSDVNKGFAAPTGPTTFYVAALLTIPVGGTNSEYFLHLLNRPNPAGTGARSFLARLFARSAGGANQFNLGISITSATPTAFTAATFAEGQPYLVVLKYTYAPGGTDELALFAFDNAATLPVAEPVTPAVGPVQQANNSSFFLPNGVGIRQDSNTPAFTLDGLRVATGWGTAVGHPVYTAAGAAAAAGNYYDLTLNNADVLTPNGAVNVEGALALTSGLINTSVPNSLTLYSTATISGGSASSFVNGPLIRRTSPGAATTVFPIGKGAAYRPLTLTAAGQTAATTYTAEQFEGNPGQNFNPADVGLGTAPLQRVSFRRSYTLSSSVTTPGNFTGTLTLSFEPDDYVNVPGSPDLVVAKRDGGAPNNWLNLGRSAYTGGAGAVGGPYLSGTLTSQPFSNFSDFALAAQDAGGPSNPFGSSSNPLPVTLTRFSAQRQPDQMVSVRWATASEQQSARFEVQRSRGGRDFGTVATVAARGTSSEPTAYAALDRTAPAGPLYYRLRQVDADGTATFSPVVAVTGSSNPVAKILLYPNPTRHTLSFLAETATPYRVLNQLGQVLLHGTSQAGPATIPVETLAPGLYFLEAQTAAGRVVQKFEKQ